jgi:hypothetical protein
VEVVWVSHVGTGVRPTGMVGSVRGTLHQVNEDKAKSRCSSFLNAKSGANGEEAQENWRNLGKGAPR